MKLLMPIAVNMQQVNFGFGDYIQREGTVPKGLYLIKSGQCNVSKVVIETREHNVEALVGRRKLVKDKHPLFNNFDPDNSLLNNVKMSTKVAQNARIYVNEDGEQVKGVIQYENLITYSKLAPRNWFGGRVLMPFELYQSLRRVYFGSEYI
jgi:CRP-like cAMP-binding protein